MSFCNILAMCVCITQMSHQGAILAHRPAERESGYLHVNQRSPKLLPWDVPEDGHWGPVSSFSLSFFMMLVQTDDLSKFQSPSLGVLIGSCRPVFIFLDQSSPFNLSHPPVSLLSPQNWVLDHEGLGLDLARVCIWPSFLSMLSFLSFD